MSQSLRLLAIVGLLAFFLGRAIAPALPGAREGLDQIIRYADVAGGFASYLFAFGGLAAAIVGLMLTLRERRLGFSYRIGAVVTGVCVVMLLGPAFREPLPERASIAAALASSVLAIMASREAIAVPRTRALGVLLAAAGGAALLHLAGGVLAWYAGEHALYRLAIFARVLATASVFFDTLALLTAFAWLMTRNRLTTVWTARIALFVAFVLAWGAARAVRDAAPLWQLVTYRALERLLPMPDPYVWISYRYALETCSPLLALAAITARGQIPAVAAAFALALIARPTTDVPLSALALTVAALSSALTARDERGMWAVLMANAREGHAPLT
ncbi:MAG TPA: hypothetical protein VJT73_02105 [Polyangiaceae bacterium]|nr:hypothetical protein [Polyangiaceae bacterium]